MCESLVLPFAIFLLSCLVICSAMSCYAHLESRDVFYLGLFLLPPDDYI